jgi:hypothetical protein
MPGVPIWILYIQQRWLDVALAQWTSRDLIGYNGGEWDFYRYVANNASTYADPSGQNIVGLLLPPVVFPELPLPPVRVGPIKIGPGGVTILPVYGKYCGPQSIPGRGAGVDEMDKCCATHDGCWNDNHCTFMKGSWFTSAGACGYRRVHLAEGYCRV